MTDADLGAAALLEWPHPLAPADGPTWHAAFTTESGALATEVRRLDERLAPLQEDTKALLTTRSKIQTDLALHAQIQRLENMKATLSSVKPAPATATSDGIPAADLADFESAVREF